MLNETYTLSNGVKIPKLGLGTWFIDDDKAGDTVKEAVKLGYRLIDTAQAYGNERGVGEGVRNCGLPRNEIFVTSKVAAEAKSYESAAASIDETLSKMGLDYIDMMIIHSPQPWVDVNQSDDRYLDGNRAAWNQGDSRKIWSISSSALYKVYIAAWNNIASKNSKSGAYEN